MTEPNTLPEVFDNWQEWRSVYDLCKREYLNGTIERTRARAMLTTLGYKLYDATAELDGWEIEKRSKLWEKE